MKTSKERSEAVIRGAMGEMDSNYLYPQLAIMVAEAIDAAVADAVAAETEGHSGDMDGKARAWTVVFNLCLELGMNINNDDTGVKNVMDFIRAGGK